MTHPAVKDAAGKYAAAHAARYTARDLRKEIGLYNAIIRAHPTSAEADYSCTQILNIASSVIAKEVLLQAQMRLALAELGDDRDSGIPDAVGVEELE